MTEAVETGTNAAIVAALRWLRIGIVVVDPQQRVLSANAAAAETLAQAGHLELQEGHVVGAHQGAGRALAALLAACESDPAQPNVALIFAADGSALEMVAVAGGASPLGRSFVLMLNPTRRTRGASVRALRALYRLTASEARLAAHVASGSTLAEAAADLGIGIATARTHLHHALRKTATRRQAELAALIASSLTDWVCFTRAPSSGAPSPSFD
ncbi:MAG TPA: helix-turn-helix transcriptional regulator [Burkholderiaceae bacterium]|nr:helix-turn-helix transcriptional regulator [Burkholderiaceae bacterium]